MFFAILLKRSLALSCLNYEGKPVDWWLVLKPNTDNKATYVDGHLEQIGYAQDLDDQANPLMATIAPLYEPDSQLQAMFWNDELEGVDASDFGAQKGILAMDPKTDTGIFIHHITPDWPYAPEQGLVYENPDYGHHYLCLSINTSQLEAIAQALLPSKPLVYFNSFQADYVLKPAPSLILYFYEDTELAEITTSANTTEGTPFFMYSKAPFVGGLWEVIQGALKQDMFSVGWTTYGQTLGRATILIKEYDAQAHTKFSDWEQKYEAYLKRIIVSNEERRKQRELEEQQDSNATAAETEAETPAANVTVEAVEAEKPKETEQPNEKEEEPAYEDEPLLIENEKKEIVFSKKWPELVYHTHITMSNDGETVCFGDVNHQRAFRRTGSGAVCLKNEKLVRQLIEYCWATEQQGYGEEAQQQSEIEETQAIVQNTQKQ